MTIVLPIIYISSKRARASHQLERELDERRCRCSSKRARASYHSYISKPECVSLEPYLEFSNRWTIFYILDARTPVGIGFFFFWSCNGVFCSKMVKWHFAEHYRQTRHCRASHCRYQYQCLLQTVALNISFSLFF